MKKVTDKEFAVYGRVLDVDVNEFVDVMKDVPVVSEGTMYEPSVGAFEALPLAKTLEQESFGFLPIEFGHCSGYNNKLNALRVSPVFRDRHCGDRLILLVGRQQDIDVSSYTYDTARVEASSCRQGRRRALCDDTSLCAVQCRRQRIPLRRRPSQGNQRTLAGKGRRSRRECPPLCH